mmetsp:Transcript_9080/g.21156  ORF Transcript_9080/g.21156 Transcript_9080/m.21156 type:complete len:288 (-) Transcript_9080:160-1023(-)
MWHTWQSLHSACSPASSMTCATIAGFTAVWSCPPTLRASHSLAASITRCLPLRVRCFYSCSRSASACRSAYTATLRTPPSNAAPPCHSSCNGPAVLPTRVGLYGGRPTTAATTSFATQMTTHVIHTLRNWTGWPMPSPSSLRTSSSRRHSRRATATRMVRECWTRLRLCRSSSRWPSFALSWGAPASGCRSSPAGQHRSSRSGSMLSITPWSMSLCHRPPRFSRQSLAMRPTRLRLSTRTSSSGSSTSSFGWAHFVVRAPMPTTTHMLGLPTGQALTCPSICSYGLC